MACMWEQLVFAAGIGATAVLAAFGGLVVLTYFERHEPRNMKASIFREGPDATVFLFDDKDLVDATPSAYRLLTGSKFTDKPWFALMERLATRFDNLESRLSEVAMTGSIALRGASRAGAHPISLRAELRGGLTKVTLFNPVREIGVEGGDLLTVHALDSELIELRDATNAAPFPIWRSIESGEITWANTAYMDMVCSRPASEGAMDWPLHPMFDVSYAKGDSKAKPLRRLGPDKDVWFDVFVRPISGGNVSYALPADATVHAEGTLAAFKQTLTNTFAELSTGLAVFDHNRKLQLFNPALAKLIDMPLDFLLKRPSLFAMLDGMRDKNMLPEPKDYKSWRHQMVDIELMSVRGDYRETWYLPNGKTFRVVGRPYPNGAMALMVDDITDQIVRDRLSRSELDMALAVLNKVDEAVIVFSAVGQPVFANARYQALWGHDPITAKTNGGPVEILEKWRAQSSPSLVWSAVEAVLNGSQTVIEPQPVDLLNGTALICRSVEMADGGACFFFRERQQSATVKSPGRRTQQAASA
jgi:PAS domain-containing protein